MDRKLKHLEFIQGTINRLSTNSFLLKGWSVVLVAALFALSAKDADIKFVYLALFPAVVFWGLDGYFVLMERVYPELTGAYQGYTLALVGHTDKGERKNLDRDRVRNSAAVLTAGKRSCLALEPSRIQTSSIGTTESEYKDASGLASTAGSRIKRDDPRSQNRRVEIWLVPAGKPMPSVMRDAKVLDPKDLRAIGCPR